MKISVIIPVYNSEKYLKQCLDSIVNQTLEINNIEVIIVNDNSKDNSLNIINEYLSRYPSFKLINNEHNLGPGISRNRALNEVSSQYVTYVDSDDFISPNAYAEALDKLNSTESDLFIYNWQTYTGSDYVEPVNIHQQNCEENTLLNGIEDKPELILSTSPWNKVYHKRLFKHLIFPEGFYEDNIVACRALINAEKIYLSKDAVYYYRKNKDSTTENITISSTCHLTNSIAQLFNLKKDYPKYLDYIKLLSINFIYDVLFWLYYYDWFYTQEIEIIDNLKNAMIPIEKRDVDNFKKYFPEKLAYPHDIMDLTELDSETFLAKYKYFKKQAKVSSIANLYVDNGSGFNETDKISLDYVPDEINRITFDLSDFKNIRALRFDPLEGSFIKCRILNDIKIIDSNADNSLLDEYQTFLTLDPFYVLDSARNKLIVEFQLIFIRNEELANIINNLKSSV